MASLTWTKEDGTWGVTGMDFNLAKLNPLLYGALAKLKDYEKICDSPDKLREIDELYREKCEEVNALKAENEWISDRVPNEDEMKRAYCRNKYGSEFLVMIEGATRPTTLYRTMDGFWVDDKRETYCVTHWRELPTFPFYCWGTGPMKAGD